MWDLISNYLGPLITTVTAFIFMKFILFIEEQEDECKMSEEEGISKEIIL